MHTGGVKYALPAHAIMPPLVINIIFYLNQYCSILATLYSNTQDLVMTDSIKIFHNPRCSKSRATLELLNSHDAAPQIIEYLKTPPTADDLENILNMLGLQPRQLMRQGEAEYKTLHLADETLSREQLIAAMVTNPKLIERPIVIANGKAAIGRPPELVLEII